MFLKYIVDIWANCNKLIGLQFVFDPESINNNWLLYAGNIPANAGLSIPFILPTINVAPASNAPEFPADMNTSPSFSFSILNPTTIDESFLCLIASVGPSSISIVSVAFFIFSLSDTSSISFPVNSFTLFLITSSFPTNVIVAFIWLTAFNAPFILASGALSPPIASSNIFIVLFPFLLCLFLFCYYSYSWCFYFIIVLLKLQ